MPFRAHGSHEQLPFTKPACCPQDQQRFEEQMAAAKLREGLYLQEVTVMREEACAVPALSRGAATRAQNLELTQPASSRSQTVQVSWESQRILTLWLQTRPQTHA